MGSTDVLTQFRILITFSQGFDASVYIVDGLTKCRPPFGWKLDALFVVILQSDRDDVLTGGLFNSYYAIAVSSDEYDEIRPTKKGVALRLGEWADLCTLVDTINTAYPSLASTVPCYYDEDDMNQMGWLNCNECHPFLNNLSAAHGQSVIDRRQLHQQFCFSAILCLYRVAYPRPPSLR